MDCCTPPGAAQSWYDWLHAAPMNPFDLIQNAMIGVNTGAFANSPNFNTATWAASTVALKTSAPPACVALETDNNLMVADAAQWNFAHQTLNAAATLAIPLQKVIFLRGGTQWQMNITFDFGATTYTNIQLSFRDNAGTRGDNQATIPVIQWNGSFTGVQVLSVTLKQFGRFQMGLRCDTGAAVSMYDSEWMVVG